MTQRKRIKLLSVLEGNCTHIEIELFYSKGGMNYFTNSNERRGLYLSVQPVTISQNSKGYTIFTGVKQFVKEMQKFSQKTFDTFEVDTDILDKLLEHVIEKNNIRLVV